MTRFREAALLAAVIALLVAAGAAEASEAKYAQSSINEDFQSLYYTAAPGEKNKLTVTMPDEDGSTFVLEDPGATITVGKGCESDTPHRAVCAGDPVRNDDDDLDFVELNLGDEDDTSSIDTAPGYPVYSNGGDGADKLAGGGTEDQMDGGPGDDELNGGAEFNNIVGGTGSDVLEAGVDNEDASNHERADYLAGGDAPGAPEPDRFVGTGRTIADYEERTDPITIDRTAGTGGMPGEGDTLSGIGRVLGGKGGDTFIGGAAGDNFQGNGGADTVTGAGGRDRLFGGRGNDTVSGGDGADLLRGGGGDDRLNADRDGDADDLGCASGTDTVGGQKVADVVSLTCERMELDDETLGDPWGTVGIPRTRERFVNFVVGCAERCSGTIVLKGSPLCECRSAGRVGGRRKFDVPADAKRSVRMRLNKRGRELALQEDFVQIRVKSALGSTAFAMKLEDTEFL